MILLTGLQKWQENKDMLGFSKTSQGNGVQYAPVKC